MIPISDPSEMPSETSVPMDTDAPHPKDTPDISFLLVNYQSATLLPACFSSFRNVTFPQSYEILVANNDPSEEEALRALQSRFPFTLLPLPDNRGFGFAMNRTAEHARGNILVFLNPDARFLSGNLQELVVYFKKYPSVGGIGLRLLRELETSQEWNAGNPPTLWNILGNHLGLRSEEPFRKTGKPKFVGWASGAAFAIPRHDFFRIHGFDERFFLYYEDTNLCERLRKIGRKILLLPHIRVLHIGGGSMRASQQKKSYYTSQDLYFSLHRPWYEGAVLKFLRKLIFS